MLDVGSDNITFITLYITFSATPFGHSIAPTSEVGLYLVRRKTFRVLANLQND